MPILDLDDVRYIAAKYQQKGRIKPVQLIIIHSMEAPERVDTAENVARYFQNAPRIGSAHYCVDADSVIQCVWDRNTAYHCKNANANGLGIELAGYAKQTREQWLDEYGLALLDNGAQVAAYLCRKFSISPQRAVFKSQLSAQVIQAGITGHVDVPGHGTHWDPGPGFPWVHFLDRVKHHIARLGQGDTDL